MDDLKLRTADPWTPGRGLRRGLLWGMLLAAVLAVAADVLAWHGPLWVVNGYFRTAASLGSMYLLFFVVHRGSGMTGLACTAIVVVLVLAIAGSQELVWAVHPFKVPPAAGWNYLWIAAKFPFGAEIWTMIGVVFGVLLWHGGVSLGSLVDLLRQGWYR